MKGSTPELGVVGSNPAGRTKPVMVYMMGFFILCLD